ncbi:MAG: DUF2095 family protein [Candidatus Bathyarchaeia archaeon]
MIDIEEAEFKKRYPNLWREIARGKLNSRLRVTRLRDDKFRGYIPDATDYIRRCETSEQAEETIRYLLEKGEISPSQAEGLLKQLRTLGLRSFGPKKEDGFYLREAGLA